MTKLAKKVRIATAIVDASRGVSCRFPTWIDLGWPRNGSRGQERGELPDRQGRFSWVTKKG